MGLADLQRLAAEVSPLLKEARRDADDALRAVTRAGLCLDPKVGYQVVERQTPSLIRTVSDDGVPGHQGLFIARLIDTAAVLNDGQRIAGFEYVNSLIELGKAKTELVSQVRTYFCLALIAKREIEVNRALVELADGVYQMRLKRLAAGEVGGDEPRQLYVQAVEARNSLLQSQIAYQSACQHLAPLIGRHDLTMPQLVGRADTTPPSFDFDVAKARMLATHPVLLAMRFDVVQARIKRKPQLVMLPDLEIDRDRQPEICTPTYMKGVHLDLGGQRFERINGTVGSDHWHPTSASENYRLTENGLRANLAEAFGRYEADVEIAANFREKVIPSLA